MNDSFVLFLSLQICFWPQEYDVLPFEAGPYARTRLNFVKTPSTEWSTSHASMKRYIQQQLFHNKTLYAMNNNGARNYALRDGRGRARWILPFDGNCYLTPHAYKV